MSCRGRSYTCLPMSVNLLPLPDKKKKILGMIKIKTQNGALEIHPITLDKLEAVLEVYRQCEDFLALGPVAIASMEMVLSDLEISKGYGGTFCGIYTAEGEMIGVLDTVQAGFEGDPRAADLTLLMIAAPYRGRGIGEAVVQAWEAKICQDSQVDRILAGVQVNNPGAMRFWQRMGYRIVSEPKLHSDGTTAVDLRKDLKRA
jgi:ribosomal protein S18 acetylase RimI-like enzyme